MVIRLTSFPIEDFPIKEIKKKGSCFASLFYVNSTISFTNQATEVHSEESYSPVQA